MRRIKIITLVLFVIIAFATPWVYGAESTDGITLVSTSDSAIAENDTAIKAKKTLDGLAPGDKRFQFQLLDADGNILQTKENDSDGNIVFDSINYNNAGTYNYMIREVNDGQTGISYDEKTINVSVEVKAVSSEVNGKTVYSDKLNALMDDEYYYMYDQESGKYYHVYCLNSEKLGPNGINYSAIDDVSNDTIKEATAKGTSENVETIKKVLYYFLIHPDAYSNYEQQLIIWQAAGQYYLKDAEVAAICNEIKSVPSNFHITFFEPQVRNYQKLIMGYLAEEPVITYKASVSGAAVFENKASTHAGYELPATGGPGTHWMVYTGIMLVAIAAIMMTVNMIIKERTNEND